MLKGSEKIVLSLPFLRAFALALVIPLAGIDRQHLNPVAVWVRDEHRITRCHFEDVDPSLRKTSYEQINIVSVHVQGHVVHLLAAVDVAASHLEEVEALHATTQE